MQFSIQLCLFTVYNRDCKHEMKADEGHFWGYVYFRQAKDTSLKRGYFQKSFVILTRLPFHNFFYDLVARWAEIYFGRSSEEEARKVLIDGFNYVLNWPMLATNSSFELPVFSFRYQIFIPAESTNRALQSNNSSSQLMQSVKEDNNKNSSTTLISITSNEIELFGALHAIIHHMHLVFELILLGEPILVITQTPSDSSRLVQALTSIISPLEYVAEVFPYFTIHNQEFNEFVNASKVPSVILGCTNPYFAKTLSTMNIIKINESLQSGNEHPLPHRKLERVKSMQKLLTDSSNSFIYTQHKPFLQKDKKIIKQVDIFI